MYLRHIPGLGAISVPQIIGTTATTPTAPVQDTSGMIPEVGPKAGSGGSGTGTTEGCPCRTVERRITKYLHDEPVNENSIPVEVLETKVICDEVPTHTRVICEEGVQGLSGFGRQRSRKAAFY